MTGVALHPQLDPPAFGRELDRVCEKVPHDLLQTRRVAENLFWYLAEIGDERDALGLGRRAHRVERGFERRDEINRTRLDPQLTRDDARRIEQIFDDLELRLRAALDDGGNVIDGFPVCRAGAQHPRVAENSVQGRAQFMRDHRQEFVLRAVGGFGGRARDLLPRQLFALRLSLLALGDVALNEGIELPASDFYFRDSSLDRKLRAVRAERDERSHRPARAAGFAETADEFGVRAPKTFRDEAVERLPQSFRSRAAEHPLRRLVEKDDALFLINGDNRVHRRGDDAIQPLLAFEQRPLGLLLIINVGVGAEPLDDLAARILERYGSRLEPAVHSVNSANAVLDIERLAGRHSPIPVRKQRLTIVRVNLPQPVEAELLRFGDAGVSDKLRVDVITSSVGATGPDKLWQ